MTGSAAATARFERNATEWRDPAQIVAFSEAAASLDPDALSFQVRGKFWQAIEELDVTVFVSREYEHFVTALSLRGGRPLVTVLPLPHPSGIAADPARERLFVASTRNPNQLFELRPAVSALPRSDQPARPSGARPLIPLRSLFLPGCAYLHDLAFIGGQLHGNAVGQNAVIRFKGESYEPVWWPRAIERSGKPDFSRNYLQLNSIAGGKSLESSFFSASTDRIGARRPGHQNWAVDGRGVVFSGATREPVITELTRPHSARLWRNRVWVDNSGYGEVGYGEDGKFRPAFKLDGWTRGLCFTGPYAIAGTSRVIPRFKQYAPGLDADRCVCGVHILDPRSGETVGSLLWPSGNQIFSIDVLPRRVTLGFPFVAERTRRHADQVRRLFYAFDLN